MSPLDRARAERTAASMFELLAGADVAFHSGAHAYGDHAEFYGRIALQPDMVSPCHLQRMHEDMQSVARKFKTIADLNVEIIETLANLHRELVEIGRG